MARAWVRGGCKRRIIIREPASGTDMASTSEHDISTYLNVNIQVPFVSSYSMPCDHNRDFFQPPHHPSLAVVSCTCTTKQRVSTPCRIIIYYYSHTLHVFYDRWVLKNPAPN
ncbi:hypothetical protein NP493_973g00002 [Ridgeia piscesae]|uniref:Uncharacterized protein n=1 Tax=Ridgeia piscesae TaxID=27915 RepID=A0AAD9KJ64_RIDPI|nr:hypothetical protein NP493_973g00002 [Ridgeia piscesae]